MSNPNEYFLPSDLILSKPRVAPLIAPIVQDVSGNLTNRMDKIEKDNIQLKRDNKMAKVEINQLKLEMQTKQEKIDRMEAQMDEVHISHTVKLKNLEESQLASKDLLNRETIFLKNEILNLNNEIMKISSIAPFEWRIRDFVTKRKEGISKCIPNIYSEPFYSHKNGYKLRLRVNPNGFGDAEDTHLSVFFSIINGENDDTLSWPMQRQVKIALIDQISGKIFISQKYGLTSLGNKKLEVCFDKPSNRTTDNDDYYYYGTPNFIELIKLTNNKSLIVEGSILLKCFID